MRRSITHLLSIWIPAGFLARAEDANMTAKMVAVHTDPVEVWGTRFLIAVVAIGMAVLLFTMIRYRGRTAGAISWGLLAAGVAVLPLVATGFGTLIVFDRAERVEFCASCHLTMKEFVEDMRDAKSESLAAVHFKNKYIPDNQCYVCHTSYGMFGTVEAKQAGMIDVYKYFTRTYHKPIQMREPYPNHDCLKCHLDSAKWLKHDEHMAAREDLLNDKMKCLDCHSAEHPAHNIPVEKAGSGASGASGKLAMR